MNDSASPAILTLGLFEKRFEGDDSLMQLSRLRFSETGMSAEVHAGSTEQLRPLLKFRPLDQAQVVVHLPRDYNLVEEKSTQKIVELAKEFTGQIHGVVLHDHPAMASHLGDYVSAAWKLENQLEQIRGCPTLFVEYAAGLEPEEFLQFFSDIRDLDHISACVDIGHVGIRAARAAYAREHGGEDVCELKSQGPKLRQVIAEVESSVASAVDVVLELVDEL
ncbi:MAG TPA: hypothetical protein VHI52_16015, partial [Verrucomicrobiae bacterium]|nr:hypothetical protein [Verrucomicrobiae bacterium]